MQHAIPVNELIDLIGPQVRAMASAVEACVHCGFCLPVCPTYQVLGEEMDSPRGRILLIKSVLEGELTARQSATYIDRCLGCLACVTACPSGVRYGDLISSFRTYANREVEHSFLSNLQRVLIRETIPYPVRFRSAASLGRLVNPIRKALPGEIQSLIDLLPEELADDQPLPSCIPAEGERRAKVALLKGCVQQAIAPQITRATIRVLAANGVEVLLPGDQSCCGALFMHMGDGDRARRMASVNLGAFPKDVDAILTTAAGCGSGMKEYGLLFTGHELEELAERFVSLVRDICEFLLELGMLTPPPLQIPLNIAYHDACHLAHAQGVRDAPRKLLSAIPNVKLFDILDEDICCGSAGTYNIEQPEIAGELGRRKVENILSSGGEVVVTGNIGCMVQIQKYLSSQGNSMPVYHTLEILDMAYQQVVM